MNLHRGRSDMGRSCPPREVYAGPPGACSTMPRLCTPPEPTRDGRAGCGTGLDGLAQMAPPTPAPKSHVRPDPQDGALFGNEAFADVIS